VERVDVVVIGAGVMGSATARALGERGVETVLLEQFDLGHARGSSHGPTRIFRLAYPDPLYVEMAQLARESWRELEAAAGEDLLVTTGGIDAGPLASLCGAALEPRGVTHEWLTPAQAAERFPSISFDGLDPILFQADAGVSRAGRTVAAQVRLARQSGVDVRDRTEVAAVEPNDDGVEVRTTDGSAYRARVAVVTAGSWAGPLLVRAGRPVGLQPILQTIAYFGPAQPGAEEIPTFIEWGSPEIVWYALPPAGVAPGVKLGAHVGGKPVDPSAGPFPPDEELERVLAKYVAERFPGLVPEPIGAETCLYTMTDDEDFVLDRAGPLVVGAGFSGHGFKFGPLVGEALSDLATGREPRFDLTRFGLDRAAVRRA
jgi:sarcosine oxidase